MGGEPSGYQEASYTRPVTVTRPLQLFAIRDSATITVTCTDISGEELAKFTLDADSKLDALLVLIRERVSRKFAAWTIISPSGDVLDDMRSDSDVKSVLFGEEEAQAGEAPTAEEEPPSAGAAPAPRQAR